MAKDYEVGDSILITDEAYIKHEFKVIAVNEKTYIFSVVDFNQEVQTIEIEKGFEYKFFSKQILLNALGEKLKLLYPEIVFAQYPRKFNLDSEIELYDIGGKRIVIKIIDENDQYFIFQMHSNPANGLIFKAFKNFTEYPYPMSYLFAEMTSELNKSNGKAFTYIS